ncbi:hypothetical protein [Streptodolium elevatio]
MVAVVRKLQRQLPSAMLSVVTTCMVLVLPWGSIAMTEPPVTVAPKKPSLNHATVRATVSTAYTDAVES